MLNYSNFSFVLTFFLFSVLIGCEKEESPITKIAREATFTCIENTSEYYFEGVIDDQKVCFHIGFDGYDIFLRKATGFTTGATIDPNRVDSLGNRWGVFSIEPKAEYHENLPWQGNLPPGSQYFQIETPKFPMGTELKEIVEEVIKEGELELIEENDREQSFNIKIVIVSEEDGTVHVPLQSFGGNQDNSFLKTDRGFNRRKWK